MCIWMLWSLTLWRSSHWQQAQDVWCHTWTTLPYDIQKKYQKFFFFLILMVVQTLHTWLYFVNLYYMSSHEKNLRSFNGINKKRQFEWNMYKSNGEVVHVWHHTSWARCQCEDPHSSSDHNIQMLITFLLFIHFFSNFHWSASLIFLFLYNLMNS